MLRRPVDSAIYTSLDFAFNAGNSDVTLSYGSTGDCYDANALMESIIGLFKTECMTTTVFHDGPYRNLADIEYATAGWVDWYSHRRLHGTLGMRTPAEHEQAYYAARQPADSIRTERQ